MILCPSLEESNTHLTGSAHLVKLLLLGLRPYPTLPGIPHLAKNERDVGHPRSALGMEFQGEIFTLSCHRYIPPAASPSASRIRARHLDVESASQEPRYFRSVEAHRLCGQDSEPANLYAVFKTSTLAIGSGALAGRVTSIPSAVRVTFSGLWAASARSHAPVT